MDELIELLCKLVIGLLAIAIVIAFIVYVVVPIAGAMFAGGAVVGGLQGGYQWFRTLLTECERPDSSLS